MHTPTVFLVKQCHLVDMQCQCSADAAAFVVRRCTQTLETYQSLSVFSVRASHRVSVVMSRVYWEDQSEFQCH